VRARPVAGDVALAAQFEVVRQRVLCQPHDPAKLRQEIADMRERIRHEKALPKDGFDLKLSPGGRVDVEFIAQYLVLAHAQAQPAITGPRGTADILRLAGELGLLPAAQAAALAAAFVTLCALERRQTLQGAGGVVDAAAVAEPAQTVLQVWSELFGPRERAF
jgi:glutamate-ammonia-ligase adenylyltransferase